MRPRHHQSSRQLAVAGVRRSSDGLQGRGVDAAKSTTRFLVNTIMGLGGLLDIAKDMGLPYDETNFDETFYRWGVPEGGYWELLLVGPGTQRDWTGYALDQLSDPMFYVLPVAAVNSLFGARRPRRGQ